MSFVPVKIPRPSRGSWKFIPFKIDDPFIESEYNNRKYLFLKYQSDSLYYRDWEFGKSDYINVRSDVYVFCWIIGGSRKHIYYEHAYIMRPKINSSFVVGNVIEKNPNTSENVYKLKVENGELIVDFAKLTNEEIEDLKVYLLNKGYSIPKVVGDEYYGKSFWNSIACAYIMKYLLKHPKTKKIIIEVSEDEIEKIIQHITKVFPNLKIEITA